VNNVAVGVEDYAYNALGALKVNAGVTLNDQRPRLDGGGTADSGVPSGVGTNTVTMNTGGYVTAIGGVGLSYSARGFFIQATPPVPALPLLYAVDASRKRIWEQHGTTGTANDVNYDVWEGMDRVAIIGPDPLGTPLRQGYLFDGIDHPLRIRTGSTIAYYELDLAGNVRRLRLSGGSDLGGYRYSAFGKTVENTAIMDQSLRWKARWFNNYGGFEVYDIRARQWSPDLGTFLSADEFSDLEEVQRAVRAAGIAPSDAAAVSQQVRFQVELLQRGLGHLKSPRSFGYHDPSTTLWGWPGQNPLRWQDPSGHGKLCAVLYIVVYQLCKSAGLGVVTCQDFAQYAYERCEKQPNPPNACSKFGGGGSSDTF
jgi:hypothetical protein